LGVFRKPLTQSRIEMNAPANTSQDITQMLREWSDGKREALAELMPLVYDELRRQAANYLRRERPDHTLQTTALIHEAYLKLIDQRDVDWQSRAHFFAISAQAMRRILVDYARTKHREKRGGDAFKLPLEEAALMPSEENRVDLMALDEALTRLGEVDEEKARIVELRYFSGLSTEETATVLRVSTRTVERGWTMAKAWLRRELNK
jgi:RNA polymerase sigma factor (TIGR02999 family)